MKKFAIFIIIGSLLSGFFLPGILGVTLTNNNIAFAQDPGDGGDTETGEGSPIQTPEPESMFSCNFEFDAANLINCVGAIAYIPYYITHIIAAVSGMFLDTMLDYSTQSASYESGFVSEGWKIIRDLTNIGFIFALLYIAISTIVGQGSAKSTLVWVIIMALVVNFSFFTTRVVIDASNILARVFYQNINVQEPNANADPNQTTKSITAALISKINIQNIENDVSASLQEQPDAMDPWKIALAGILITILVTIVNLVMIFVFFSIAMLFVGRVIGLWFSIIASPLAFLSIAFPGGKGWRRVGWDAWTSDLIGTAFLAPVFLFFIYLIILFLNTGFLTDAMSGGTTLSSVLVGIIVPFAFFMTLLLTAKKISSELAGQIASTVTGYLNTAMMAVGGVAMAGTALAGGAVAGVAGRAITQAGARTLANNATATGTKGKLARFAGRSMTSTGRGINNVNWDPRNAPGMSQISKMTGIPMPTTGQGVSSKYGSGKGITELKEKRNEEWRKKKQARADELADAVAKHGVDPVTGNKLSAQVEEHKDNKEEFMAKFGNVMDKIDSNIKEKGDELKEARMLLKAAQDTKDPAKIAKAETDQSKALDAYINAKKDKDAYKKGSVVDVPGFGKVSGSVNGRTLDNIETSLKNAEQAQIKATTGARNFYAEEIKTASGAEKTMDAILSGGASMGQHKQASRDVRNKAKEEEKKAPKPEPTTT